MCSVAPDFTEYLSLSQRSVLSMKRLIANFGGGATALIVVTLAAPPVRPATAVPAMTNATTSPAAHQISKFLERIGSFLAA